MAPLIIGWCGILLYQTGLKRNSLAEFRKIMRKLKTNTQDLVHQAEDIANFKVHALDIMLYLPIDSDKNVFLKAIYDHIGVSGGIIKSI